MFARLRINPTNLATRKLSAIEDSSKELGELIHTGPHRVGPNRPGWARSVSALKLLNILGDVTGYVIIDGAPGLATPLTLTLVLYLG